MKQKALAFVSLFVILVALAGCAIGPAAAPASKELNVLCTPQEEWCQGMKQEFEKKYGITVNYVRMSSGEALARIQAEKDNPQFDIWWGGPIDSFVAAKTGRPARAVQLPQLRRTCSIRKSTRIRTTTGRASTSAAWASAPTRTGWRRIPASRPPTSWDDLLKPEFKGQIMVAHPSTSGTSYTALATILQIDGRGEGLGVSSRSTPAR